MGGYIILAWREASAAAASPIKASLAKTPALRLVVDRSNLAVFLDRDRPLPCVQLPGGRGVVIGSIFDRRLADIGRGRIADLAGALPDDPERLCRTLAATTWGSYVAALPADDGALNMFRDPLGGLECLTWTRDGVFVAASGLDPSAPHGPRQIAVDWAAVGALLRQKSLSSVTVPLIGVGSVDPGVLRRADGVRQVVWRPSLHAATSAARPDVTPRDLAAVVDGCIAAWSADRAAILCEVSGGLDSSVVLASLHRLGAPVIGAVHYYWAEREADERVFARAMAERAGLDLTEQGNGLLILDEAQLSAVAGAARPSFNAQDPHYDADMAARLNASGADALFTGQGGDAVFYQMANADLAGDLLRGLPSGRRPLEAMALLARRTRRTVWSLLGEALRTAWAPVTLREPISFLSDVCARPGPMDRHPWLGDLGAVSPAKRVQIRALANNQGMFGESLRGRGGRLIQPLMSQPVVELCLSIPAPRLAIGELDRPFAREAFADRLPVSVLERRWKGDLSVFFARSMAENLPFLRRYLMDGQLAAQGLIDPGRLERILDPDILIWFDHFGELTIALMVEAWVRWWSAALSGRVGGSAGTTA